MLSAKKYVLIVVFGYAALISYTWPMGFVPLVSLASLPIVILGFVALAFFFFLFACFLLAPWTWLTDKEFVTGAIFNKTKLFDDVDSFGESCPTRIDVPILSLISDAYSSGSLYSLASFLLLAFGLIITSSLA